MCGGGGGTSVTQTYDPKYNQGMLELSQEQQGWAKELYNQFKYGVTYDPNEAVRGAYINGKWVNESDLPKVVTQKGTPGRWEYYDTRTGARVDPNSQGVVWGPDSIGSNIQKRWIDGTTDVMGIDPSIKLETRTLGEVEGYDPNKHTSQLQYMQNIVDANQQLLQPRTQLELEQLNSAQQLLPIQTELQQTSLQDQTQAIRDRAPLRSELYSLAQNSGDEQLAMNQAQADVQHGFDNTQRQFERRMFLSGIRPDDSGYTTAINERNLAKARAIAGARSFARDKAQADKFSKLRTALATM